MFSIMCNLIEFSIFKAHKHFVETGFPASSLIEDATCGSSFHESLTLQTFLGGVMFRTNNSSFLRNS